MIGVLLRIGFVSGWLRCDVFISIEMKESCSLGV
jgi:hypothetical protein